MLSVKNAWLVFAKKWVRVLSGWRISSLSQKLVLTHLCWGSAPTIPGRIRMWKCWFVRRGENRSTRRKTSRSKGENQQHVVLTPGFEPGLGHNGGRRLFSPLCHPCSPNVGARLLTFWGLLSRAHFLPITFPAWNKIFKPSSKNIVKPVYNEQPLGNGKVTKIHKLTVYTGQLCKNYNATENFGKLSDDRNVQGDRHIQGCYIKSEVLANNQSILFCYRQKHRNLDLECKQQKLSGPVFREVRCTMHW